MTEQRIHDLNGHRCVDTGRIDKAMPVGNQTVWECQDCKQTASRNSFAAGLRGCPARPESLDNLSVCPGGDKCEGHPDENTAEFRAWKASNNLPKETIPRRFHTADDFAKRAATQYLSFADRIGMKMSVWAAEGMRVGPEGGTVAEMTFRGQSYLVRVDPFGNIRAVELGEIRRVDENLRHWLVSDLDFLVHARHLFVVDGTGMMLRNWLNGLLFGDKRSTVRSADMRHTLANVADGIGRNEFLVLDWEQVGRETIEQDIDHLEEPNASVRNILWACDESCASVRK